MIENILRDLLVPGRADTLIGTMSLEVVMRRSEQGIRPVSNPWARAERTRLRGRVFTPRLLKTGVARSHRAARLAATVGPNVMVLRACDEASPAGTRNAR